MSVRVIALPSVLVMTRRTPSPSVMRVAAVPAVVTPLAAAVISVLILVTRALSVVSTVLS